jgi:long-chain acyl-CoA synthetase
MAQSGQAPLGPRTLAEVARTAATNHASRIALRAPGKSGIEAVSYEALDYRSAAAREAIREHSGDGDFVVLAGDSSVAWVLAFLGIVRAGAIPVPLNQDMDDESLRSIMEEIRPALVIGDEQFHARVESHRGGRIELSAIEDSTKHDSERLDAAPDPDQLAMLLYTTGTMGSPKGVMLSHNNILSNVTGILEAAKLGGEDSVLTPLPLFHAFPLTVGLLAPLVQGVRVELEPKPTRLAARIRQAQPTLLLGVPALFEAVLRQVRLRAGGGIRGKYMATAKAFNRLLIRTVGVNAGRLLFRPVHRALGGHLRYAVSGGAPLSIDLQREATVLGVPLLQGYGMTEASPVVAVQRFEPRRFWFGKHYWKAAGSCGCPLRDVHLRFDDEGSGGADGGEVVVSGPNVMLGYFDRDQDTEDALRDGNLHTGDIGILDSDGNLRIRGRSRLAVKTERGEMVHLDRIAEALAAAPEVAQAYAFVSDESPPRLTAIVLPAADVAPESTGLTADDLEARVLRGCQKASRHLATYERIKGLRLTDQPLPATPLGKVRATQVSLDPSFDVARWRAHLAELDSET